MKKAKTDYRKVAVQGDTIFLYAPIGSTTIQENGQSVQVGISDTDFIQALHEASNGNPVVKIRINSNGGSTKHGAAIIAAMENSPSEIHTYNDGTAASMAAGIWLMGKKRYMAKNAILMLHNPSALCEGTAKDMRECAEALDKIAESMMLGLAQNTGKTTEEIKSKYFADYRDVFLTHADAEADGLLSSDEDAYDAGSPAPEPDVISALARDPFAEFTPEERSGIADFIDQIRNYFSPKAQEPPMPPAANINDVTKEEFKAALEAGNLSAADVQAILNEHQAATTPPTPPEDPKIAALESQMAAMKAEFEAKLTAFAAAPGEGRATPGKPGEDVPAEGGKVDALAAFNAEMEAAAKDGHIRFTPSVKG